MNIAILLLVTCVGFENLAVTTVMPAVATDLNGLPLYPVAFGATTAVSLVGMVVAGEWCDRNRVAAAFGLGVGAFAVGLIVCGAAPNMLVLIAARAMVGLGFGAVYVSLYVVVGRASPVERRPQAFAAIAAAWILPGLVGPLVAGIVAENFGWRWVFWLVLPLLAPAVLVLAPAVRNLRHPRVGRVNRRSRLPWSGLAALGVGLLYVGGQLDFGLLDVGTALMLVGLVVIAAATPVLVPAGTFRARRGLPAVIALRGLLGGAFLGAQVVLPLLLMSERGYSTAEAGAVLAIGACTWAGASWMRSRTATRIPPPAAARVGLTLLVGGITGVATLAAPAVPVWSGVIGWAVAGAGIGFIYPTLSVLALDLAAPGEQGSASAGLQLGESIGGAVVLAGIGFAFAVLVSTSSTSTFLVSLAGTAVVALIGLSVSGRIGGPPVEKFDRSACTGAKGE